jgi:hypothetical protein
MGIAGIETQWAAEQVAENVAPKLDLLVEREYGLDVAGLLGRVNRRPLVALARRQLEVELVRQRIIKAVETELLPAPPLEFEVSRDGPPYTIHARVKGYLPVFECSVGFGKDPHAR